MTGEPGFLLISRPLPATPMSLCNSTTVMMLVLAALATWNYPWGLVLDGGIVACWVLIKRKRPVAGRAAAAAKAAPGQAGTGDDAIKLLAAAMLADRVDASGSAAAASLGLPPDASRAKRVARAGALADDLAYRQRLLD